jgi:hypothetical protein
MTPPPVKNASRPASGREIVFPRAPRTFTVFMVPVFLTVTNYFIYRVMLFLPVAVRDKRNPG